MTQKPSFGLATDLSERTNRVARMDGKNAECTFKSCRDCHDFRAYAKASAVDRALQVCEAADVIVVCGSRMAAYRALRRCPEPDSMRDLSSI